MDNDPNGAGVVGFHGGMLMYGKDARHRKQKTDSQLYALSAMPMPMAGFF